MNSLSTLKTTLKTLIGASIASTLMTLPVEANEDKLVKTTTNSEIILSQNFDYGDYGDRQTYSEPSDKFKTLVGLTGLAVGTGIIGYHVTKAYNPSWASSLPNLKSISKHQDRGSLLDRINPKLRQELLRLVHNRATASRLLAGTLISHPNRSPNWVAEKVIYDLKRDR